MTNSNMIERDVVSYWRNSAYLRHPEVYANAVDGFEIEEMETLAIHAYGRVRDLADRELRRHGKHREADRAATLSAGGWVEDDEAVG